MKPANATVQDDIPPVHVLEAAQNQERKETEDLLAGFDRPGRSPKPVSKERDFVDYYARKKAGVVDSGSGSGSGRSGSPVSNAARGSKPPRPGDVATVIVPRKREGLPPWLGWAAVTLGMLLVGGVVAYLATGDGRPTAGEPTAPSTASAATTITSATPPSQLNAQPNVDTNIPPPGPVEPTTTTAVTIVEPLPSAQVAVPAGSGARRRDGRAGAGSATGAAPSNAARPTNGTDETKPPPRDDFIRDL